MAFCDRVLRPESPGVAARQLRRLAGGPEPAFLSPTDRALLRWGARLSSALPGTVVPLARRRLRAMVGELVADAEDPALGRHLARLRAEGFGVNVNLLGEAVLGDEEAARRRDALVALMARRRRRLRLGQGLVRRRATQPVVVPRDARPHQGRAASHAARRRVGLSARPSSTSTWRSTRTSR